MSRLPWFAAVATLVVNTRPRPSAHGFRRAWGEDGVMTRADEFANGIGAVFGAGLEGALRCV